MRTSVRTFISFGVATGVFGSLVLWTEWGQRTFHPDADSMGIFWLVMAGGFVVLGGLVQAFSKPGGAPPAPADDEPEKEEVDDPGTPLCPSCLAPAERLQHFCAECGSPLTSHAEIDPLGRIYSMGDTFRKAAASPRRRIVLIGMWCIFALPLVFVVIGLVSVLDQRSDVCMPGEGGLMDWNEMTRPPAPWTLSRIFQLSLLMGVALLYGAIVIKTTRNYFRKKQILDTDATNTESTENTEGDA